MNDEAGFMSRTRYKVVDNHYPYMLTATVIEWMPLLSRPDIVRILLDSMQFMQENGRMTIYGYVIMIDHLHMVASAEKLSTEFGNFISNTARQIIDYYKAEGNLVILKKLAFFKKLHKTDREYQFWQDGGKPKQISDRKIMTQKIEYMHFNPVRCGYIDLPEHWRYSSARNYQGEEGLISVCRDW